MEDREPFEAVIRHVEPSDAGRLREVTEEDGIVVAWSALLPGEDDVYLPASSANTRVPGTA